MDTVLEPEEVCRLHLQQNESTQSLLAKGLHGEEHQSQFEARILTFKTELSIVILGLQQWWVEFSNHLLRCAFPHVVHLPCHLA